MWDEEYWHLENLMNLEQIGRPFGFKLCVLPVKWVGDDGAPVRGDRDRGGLSAMLLSFDEAACTDVEVAGGKGASLARMTALGHAGAARLRRPGRRARGGAGRHASRRSARCSRAARPARTSPPSRRRRIALVRAADSGGAFPARGRRRPTRASATAAGRRALERDGGGLRGGELRRPAGDLPARARRRRDRRAHPRLLVLVLHRARALLPQPEGVAGRPRDGRRRPAHGRARRRRRDVHDRPDAAAGATGWSSRRSSGSARASSPAQLTPDHYVLARDGRVKRTRLAPQPYAIVRDPAGGDGEERARRRGGRRGRRSTRTSSRGWPTVGLELEERLGGPQDIEWAIQDDELFVLQSRARHGVGPNRPSGS